MIKKDTIDRIFDAVRIEEVVGDFVSLKKRGANLLGVCPFHNEKTPSFTVTPVKGIYKCFGCGKGGDSVKFVMEHEKFSYPEALRYLAKKYNIEIEESQDFVPNTAESEFKESLFIVSAFAQQHFTHNLWETDPGKQIGLSYFRERGFREEIIHKFQLGYSIDEWSNLTDAANQQGYKTEFLEATGLSIKNDQGRIYDRFRGRVMFPIHSLSGRVIAFGGRVLKTDPKSPKYVNSPETEIYHKSNVLYGLYFAKKAIREFDTCYLVEGYTDVISLHQAGIENVVASSGTSLTVEQIRLIARFTQNVTILYDGDAAGIKASLRGIDMILEEGLNVKIVLFPEGNDPDSYVREVGASAFKEYILQTQKDFILFKSTLLLAEVANDPIKKAGLIRDIVETIAKIPDSIKASVFVKECSNLLEIEERVLLAELNKLRLAKSKKGAQQAEAIEEAMPELPPEPSIPVERNDAAQEQELIRLLFNYGSKMIPGDEEGTEHSFAAFIIHELEEVSFDQAIYAKVIKIYESQLAIGALPDESFFIHHEDQEISLLAVSLLTSNYQLSENWKNTHGILVKQEEEILKEAGVNAINHLKVRKLNKMIRENQEKMSKVSDPQELEQLQRIHMSLSEVKKELSKALGAVILR